MHGLKSESQERSFQILKLVLTVLGIYLFWILGSSLLGSIASKISSDIKPFISTIPYAVAVLIVVFSDTVVSKKTLRETFSNYGIKSGQKFPGAILLLGITIIILGYLPRVSGILCFR